MTYNDQLNSLSPKERELALKILQEYKQQGNSSTFNELQYQDFEEIPVDVETFLKDPRYLGKGLTDEEGRFTVFPYWVDMMKKIFPNNRDTAYNTLILTGAIGIGKAQPLNCLVLTEQGYKKMGELTLKDRVFGNDGKLHNILGIFPQGKKSICKVTFNDKTSTLCCDEHLWKVYNTHTKHWSVIQTKQLIDGSRNIHKDLSKPYNVHRYRIPVTNSIEFTEKPVFIDPYILGVLIGDGSLHTNTPSFASIDQEIIKKVSENLHEDYELHHPKSSKYNYSICKKRKNGVFDLTRGTYIESKNLYTEQLELLGLNKCSFDKFIPPEYLYNSIPNRIKLLQGLMDTDGTICKTGSTIQYNTTSERLKNDFIFLIQSLGGTCRVCTKTPYYKSPNGEKVAGRLCYTINVKLPKDISPFSLTRKKVRLNPKSFEPTRYIDSVEYVGEDYCQCIYIDSEEHLYLTNDCIVTHNTMIADLCLLYQLHRLLCLKDPYLYYGLQPIDKITISLINISLDAAKGVAWDKLQQLIQTSEWFLAHGSLKGKSNIEYVPNKRIELIVGSRNSHVIGRAVFSSFEDEINFSAVTTDIEKIKTRALKLITQVDARMQSRFMKGTKLPTLNIIASSKDSEQSFLETYIETKKEGESKTTLIVDEPQWVIRTDKNTSKTFYVAVGNKFLASELLPLDAPEEMVDEYKRKGYQLLEVPEGYYENFRDNIDIALTDIAGISTVNALKYISGIRWNEIKTTTYENPFKQDIIEVGNAKDDLTQYSEYFDLNSIDPKLKSKPMFIHLDMSVSGDKTGIAGIWIIGKKPTAVGENASKELFYKLAFSISIKAPKGYQISFDKNRTFIRWLKKQGFNIKGISADTFASPQILQQLSADGFNTHIISVDRVDPQSKSCLPYAHFKSVIYERRLEVYDRCDLLTQEIIGLERLSNGKIEHPDAGRSGSKDCSDAVCGALYNASQNAENFAYDYGETINAMIEASDTASSPEEQLKLIRSALENSLKQSQQTRQWTQQVQESIDSPVTKMESPLSTTKNQDPNKQPEQKQNQNKPSINNAKPANLLIKDGILFW